MPTGSNAESRKTSRPVVVSGRNGIRGVAKAYEMITKEGADPLDAVIAGINIQELDPEELGVGLGGLPNEDGVVQLDASVMHGPTKRAGAVAGLEGIATPSLVAKAVMDYTDHVLLVGEGAKKFALRMGFQEQDLMTPRNREAFLRWKARSNSSGNWLEQDPDVRIPFTRGTINMNAVTAAGDIGSCTSTSGLSWKLPGRAGDTPIIGAGNFCDNDVGAAGSTGRGEANIKTCGAFLAVEFMRQGMEPEEALMQVIHRIIATTEDRLLGANGLPNFDLNFFALNKAGQVAGASLYRGAQYAVCDENGPRLLECAYLYEADQRPQNSMIHL